MLSPDARSRPLLAEMRSLLGQRHRMSSGLIDKAWAMFGEPWADQFEETLARLFPSAAERAAAVDGYAAFATAMLRLQARFEQTGRYEVKDRGQVMAEVYGDDAYMQSEYLPGLLLSHYLWPHHVRQLRFFATAFLEQLAVAGTGDIVEIGVGTGLYSRVALRRLSAARGRGVDISPAARAFAERHAAAFGLAERYGVDLEDVVGDTAAASADALICVEVLEHLADPRSFLRALRRVLRPGGRAFVTAALNAAHADHVYLYRRPAEVEGQIVDAGFLVEQYMVAFATAAHPGAPTPHVAAFVVH